MQEQEIVKTQEQLSDELDRMLLEVVKNGVPVINEQTGEPVKDENNKILRIPPPAAYLNVARQRLRDLGISKVPAEGDATDELRKHLEGCTDPRTLKLPEVSTKPDAATA